MDNVVSINSGALPRYYGLEPYQCGTFTFGLEYMADMVDELAELFQQHWDETEVLYLDDPMEPDYEMFFWLEENRKMLVFTVRDADGTMVGNAMFMLGLSVHMKGVLQAKEDTFYLSKNCRGKGLAPKFVDYIEECMRELGVVYMGMSDKSPVGGQSLKRMMERQGFRQIAVYYTKKLQPEEAPEAG